MPQLLIVESPSKCKKIKSLLSQIYPNDSFEVLACCGHFRHIEFIRDNFEIGFQLDTLKQSTVSRLRPYLATHEIILATDDDREGEAIAWHLCDYFGLPVDTTKRILFHEITLEAMKRAIEQPTKINMRIVEAQLSRMICDRWIGYTFSPVLWEAVGNKKLSAGRCQTPTLKLTVDRENEISTTTPHVVFRTVGTFGNDEFHLKKDLLSHSKCLTFIEESRTFNHEVLSVVHKISKRKPPEPFCTSTLQQWASSQWQWNTRATMSVAQSLYEKGCITYHRTESKSIAEEFKEKMVKYLTDKYGESFVKHKVVRKKDGKTLAHECIRPTTVLIQEQTLTNEEQKLYDAIYIRTMQSVMTEAVINVLTVRISCPIPKQYYEKNVETVQFEGYRIMEQGKSTTKKEISYEPNTIVEIRKIKHDQIIKNTVHHYSEGQIVKLLDEKKIGRPSTFSSFVEKVLFRKYVYRGTFQGKSHELLSLSCVFPNAVEETKTTKQTIEKNKIIVTPLGQQVCNVLYRDYDCFFNFDYTAKMEASLDQIADGTLSKQVFLQNLQNELAIKKRSPVPTAQRMNPNVLRMIPYNHFHHVSIRKGHSNDYIFVQKEEKEKPMFLSLRSFSESYLSCKEELVQEYIDKELFPNR